MTEDPSDVDAIASAISALIAEEVGVTGIVAADRLKDLGADSLEVTVVALAIENRFGVTVDPELLIDGRTVRELAEHIRQLRPA